MWKQTRQILWDLIQCYKNLWQVHTKYNDTNSTSDIKASPGAESMKEAMEMIPQEAHIETDLEDGSATVKCVKEECLL